MGSPAPHKRSIRVIPAVGGTSVLNDGCLRELLETLLMLNFSLGG